MCTTHKANDQQENVHKANAQQENVHKANAPAILAGD